MLALVSAACSDDSSDSQAGPSTTEAATSIVVPSETVADTIRPVTTTRPVATKPVDVPTVTEVKSDDSAVPGAGSDDQVAPQTTPAPPPTAGAPVPVDDPVEADDPPVASLPSADRDEPLRVAVYGDSIGGEIYSYLTFLAKADRDVTFNRNVFGGTNACDWLDEAERDARRFDPDVVITVFVGNNFTPCIRDAGQTAEEIAWRTVVDTNALASLFADDVPVYRVGYARGANQQRTIDDAGIGNRVDAIRYLLDASSSGRLRFIDGSEVLLEDGRYTETLPCSILDTDNCGDDGRIRVRAADGVHLCPTVSRARSGVIVRCPAYSSGAARLASQVFTSIFSPTS